MRLLRCGVTGSPDSDYLADFFLALDGASWTNSTSWADDSVALGAKFGVETTVNESGSECVSVIDLTGNGLAGECEACLVPSRVP